jgi:hypothetical protein
MVTFAVGYKSRGGGRPSSSSDPIKTCHQPMVVYFSFTTIFFNGFITPGLTKCVNNQT